MSAGVSRLTNEQFMSDGVDLMSNEIFDFSIGSEDDEDEVFVGDVGFQEKCKTAVVDDLCSANTFQELTDEQWAHMKENANLIVFHLWKSKLENFGNTQEAVAVTKTEHNVNDQSSPLKSKRRMISGSPYKVPPLQDITNRALMKPSPRSLSKMFASPKLNISTTDLVIYDEFELVNPMRLDFNDVEHSPKKSQCLNSYFTHKNSPLITNETGNDLLLLSSPTLKQVSAVRNSLGCANLLSLDTMKSRVRSKTYKLDEGNSILPSPLRPNISSRTNAKESQTLSKSRKSMRGEAEMKPPQKSLLNVSFTINKDAETLLRTDSPAEKTCENVNASQEPTLNESFTINKSYTCDSTGGKPSLNESFTVNKSIVRDSLSGLYSITAKGALHLSSTVNTSFKRESLSKSFTVNKSHLDGSMIKTPSALKQDSFVVADNSSMKEARKTPILNESFTINESQNKEVISTEKPILNESFTMNESQKEVMFTKKPILNESQDKEIISTKKPILNESFTMNESQKEVMSTKTPILNESFTINESQNKVISTKKTILNESFTMNESQKEVITTKKPILNESFTMNESQKEVISTKKPILNESFTMNESQKEVITTKKPILNESFTMNESQKEVMSTKKPILNESFTMNESQKEVITTKKPILNESFTMNESQKEVISTKKPILNESFTMNESQKEVITTKKPILNESFTINESQKEVISTKKPILNESFTMNESQNKEVMSTKKPILNESFNLEKSFVDASFTSNASSLAGKTSTPIRENSLKKKSPPTEKASSLKSLYNKSTVRDKSFASLKNDPASRKRTLASVMKTPTQQGSEPPNKTSVVSRSQLTKSQMPTIKSSIVPKISVSHLQPSNFTLKNPKMNFNAPTSTLQKDTHGMVKFEKSAVPVKALKSKLLMPTKLTRKSLKISPQKTILKKLAEPQIQSPVMGLKRKCIQSTPPLSKISYAKPAQSNINSGIAVNTRLAFPSKRPSLMPSADKLRQLPRPETQSKLAYKPPSISSGNVPEIKKSNLPFAGKSKLKMASSLSRPSQISYKKT